MRQVYISGCKIYVLIKRNNGLDLVCSVHKSIKGIDRPFGRGVESILIGSVLVNWRLG
jgi:hypothetical protein